MPDLLSPLFRHPEIRPDWTPRQWETALSQAMRALLVARLAVVARTHGWLDEVPPGPRLLLLSSLRMVDRQRHEVRWELEAIRRALSGLKIPVVLLKGSAYLHAGLPPAAGRLFSDIDLLVPRDSLEAAESALFAAGWISDEHDAYNEMYYRRWSHEVPPLRHVRRLSVIDLHHTIAPPTSRFKVEGAALLRQIRPVAKDPDFFVLAPADMVLHSAVHLFQEGDFDHGMRDLLDLRALLQHFEQQEGPQFWPDLLGRARGLGLQVPLHHALFHLQRLFGVRPPAALQAEVDALRPQGAGRAWMARLLDLALRPNHPSCDTRWTALARWLLYVRSHWLRMPPGLVLLHLTRKAWMRALPRRPAAG